MSAANGQDTRDLTVAARTAWRASLERRIARSAPPLPRNNPLLPAVPRRNSTRAGRAGLRAAAPDGNAPVTEQQHDV